MRRFAGCRCSSGWRGVSRCVTNLTRRVRGKTHMQSHRASAARRVRSR
jgi:hypothetical protein